MTNPPPPAVTGEPTSLLLPGHDVPLGRYTTVRRLLPQRTRRMVGAWCFVDHFGPDDVAGRPGMRVPPHPHTGLQTVSWLVEGEILHRDSLGNRQSIVPGQVNLMTAGHGIAHSEESPSAHPPAMHGLQLWIAMPDAARHGPARFEHHPSVPVLRDGAAEITVVVGDLAGARSPALVHTPLLGAEIALPAGAATRLPLQPAFEYAVLVLTGIAEVDGATLTPGSVLYLGDGRSELAIRGGGARLFLLGGEPFDEPLVMWWNFVARSHDEIVEAREDWRSGRRFGTVTGYDGGPLPAPAMPTTRLKPRDRHGRTFG
ncbi:pirin family protein [Planosporangium thailandense]|uniref:Pirin family protein n=1 Tax=Planosporangium thailandense TaxID=765197 RepID=A0ABX0Y3L4_9ACTN|nr:pirin family protein [Planosporangium thailandense]NJC72974.1 pirin family protein [Planosporangium thailandense]